MSDTYKKADQRGFGKGGKVKKAADKSFGVEDSASGQDGGTYDPDKDYEAKNDADTLHKAHEIMGDKDRHQKAAYHLEKRADAAKSAHQSSQKKLHQKVRKGLKKAFGGDTFQAEKDKEVSEAEKTVNEKD